MCALFDVLVYILDIFQFILIAAVVMSWLFAFGVVNRYNRGVVMISDMLFRLTEPALRPIRRVVPQVNGLDISYIVAFVIIFLIERIIIRTGFSMGCY
jgi:YggT family protein